jgi:hypothetical protein
MKNIKKYSLLLLASFCFAISGFAQEEEENNDEGNQILEKLVFGGNVGGGYSNGWNITLSPTVGYRVTPTTIAGVGVSYIYSDFTRQWDGLRLTTNVTGGRVFAQQLLFQNLYARGEYEYLTFTERLRDDLGRTISEAELQAPGLLVGGGYSTQFGGSGIGFTVEVLYNVIYKAETSPYPSPFIFRGGLMYGF